MRNRKNPSEKVEMEKELSSKPFTLLVPGLIGAVSCMAIFYTGASGQDFLNSPRFITWMAINTIIFMISTIFLAAWWPWFQENKNSFRNHWFDIALSLVLTTFFYALPFILSRKIGDTKLPLAYGNVKINILVSVGYLIATVPVCISASGIQAAINKSILDGHATERAIHQFVNYRDDLNRFLTFEGAVLSLFILAIASLRIIFINDTTLTEKDYPAILLLTLGGLDTLVIGLIFLPAYLSLAQWGRKLVDAYFCLPDPKSPEWSTIYQKRQTLEDYLELNISPERRFISALTFAAPFVSSIFSMLIKT